MKLRAVTLAIALVGMAGVAAAGQPRVVMPPSQAVELLSEATGLSVDKVALALGPAANYEEPVEYARANRRFRHAVGRTLYEQIMGGDGLSAQQVRHLAALAHARHARLFDGG